MDPKQLEHMRLRDRQWAEMLEGFRKDGVKEIPLFDAGSFNDITGLGFLPKLHLYPVRGGAKRGTLILCAGGGFRYKTAGEAIPTAAFFYGKGLNVAVLDYTVAGENSLVPAEDIAIQLEAGQEALAAVRYLRSHADELDILPDKIAVGGYSAGGMTAQMAMTRYTGPEDRPDAALLLYGAFARTTRVFWTDYDAQAHREAARLDPIRNIRPDCPPAFIFQTQEDDPRNALLFALELAQRGIPHEVHTFTEGRHGGALYDGTHDAPDIPHTARWAALAWEWLEANGF